MAVTATHLVDRRGERGRAGRGAAPPLNRAALDAATRWRFKPALREGVPVPSRVELLFHFEPPPPPGARVAGPPPPAGAAPAPALSAPPAPETPAPKLAEIAAIDVTVRGRRQEPNRGASDLQIEVGQLAVIANQKPSDILQLAPGIFIANEGGAGHADQVFLRGFDAEQGQAIEFTVNGVPINEVDNTDGHGYADTHFIIPELVKNLRVIEGPFSPHQGDFAEAGSADYELGVPDRRLELTASYGSFNTRRCSGALGAGGRARGDVRGGAVFQSDGYGTNRASTNASAMAEYEGELGERGSWRLLGTAYGTHYQSAGVVRADDVASGGSATTARRIRAKAETRSGTRSPSICRARATTASWRSRCSSPGERSASTRTSPAFFSTTRRSARAITRSAAT